MRIINYEGRGARKRPASSTYIHFTTYRLSDMSDGFSEKAEDASHKLIEALGRVYLQLSDSGGEKRRETGGGEDVDGGSSVRTAVGQVSVKVYE